MKNPNKYIDHTNINPHATQRDIKKTCEEAKHYNFRGVCVNPEWIQTVAEELHGTDIEATVLVDAPMGQSSHSHRMKIARAAKKHGSDEIDVVANIVDIKHDRYKRVYDDLKDLTSILPTKVIIGSGFLTSEEIEKVSEVVQKAGAMCVKTSTFKDPLDHFELMEKSRHIHLMKKGAPDLKIKAAGKIRTFDDLKLMVEAGADIIGTSTSVQIMKGAGDKYAE